MPDTAPTSTQFVVTSPHPTIVIGALMSAKLFDELPLRLDAACSTLVLPPAAVHVTRTLLPSILMLTMRNQGAGRLSTTITRCVHVALLPQSSVTVQTTWLVPMGNCAGALLTTRPLPSQLSLAVGAPRITPLA